MFVWMFVACAAASRSPTVQAPADEPEGAVLFRGGMVVGQGLVDLRVREGRIAEIGTALEAAGDDVVDVRGRFLVPAFIDSHVHLAYLPEGDAMADGGVAGAVDLAAPIEFLAIDHAPLVVKASGPMVTAEGGYPTRSWGSDGYGLECGDPESVIASVDRLYSAGAGLIKLPITNEPQLDDAALVAAVTRAHGHGLRVASHALDEGEGALAARVGVDVLAHTPVGPLSAPTVAAWSEGAVVTTLRAFGGAAATLANLRALRDAGTTVLYGTDFGNTRTAGIDAAELRLMVAAGLTGAEILAAGTSAPAAYWGLTDLGVLEVGRAASLLVLVADPSIDPESLAEAEQVWIAGARRR